MKHTMLAAGLLLSVAGTAAMASSVDLQIAPGQQFSQLQSKGSPTDQLIVNLQVKDLNNSSLESTGTQGQLQYLNNDRLKSLSIKSLESLKFTSKPGDLYAFRFWIVNTNQNKALFQCQQITNLATISDKENYILKVNSVNGNQCELIKTHS